MFINLLLLFAVSTTKRSTPLCAMYRVVPGSLDTSDYCDYVNIETDNTSYFYFKHEELTRDLKEDPHSGIRTDPYAQVGYNIWAPPMLLYQSKIICTDEFWLPAWNWIVRMMRDDVDQLDDGPCSVEDWKETLQKIAVIQKEMQFWLSQELWTPYFSQTKAFQELEMQSTILSYNAHRIMDSLQDTLLDHRIPRCLFIRNMDVADELLRSIFRKNFNIEPDHIVCMILSHLYLLENPFTFIFMVVPAAKRAQFLPK